MLSVVVPCYNEERLLAKSIQRVLAIREKLPGLEIIIVDDASHDRSYDEAKALAAAHDCIRVIRHERNQGKGAALRTGFAATTGDIVCIHDADLEYDPHDLLKMLRIIEEGADVVFGTRFLSGEARRVLYFWHSVANKIITLISNILTDLNLSDIECCYKMFRRNVLHLITIEENRFGVEPELVAKCARLNKKNTPLRIYEIGVGYYGRTYAEGKKIGPKDAARALWVILKYNLFR